MARLTIEQVKQELKEVGLEYLDGEYLNLESIINVKCSEGHEFLTSLKQARRNADCPTCKLYKDINSTEIKMNKPSKKTGKRILAIDNATYKTGYAVFESGKYLVGGVKESEKGSSVKRIADMKQWMISMIELWEVDIVGLENVQYQGNAQTLIVLSKLLGVLENTAYEITKTEPHIVSAATWKSHSNVKGAKRQQQKENAQKTVKARYGIAVSSDLADAILLGRYVCDQERFDNAVTWG